jgi:16S rRNA (guanine527-N7)-methyltransferase
MGDGLDAALERSRALGFLGPGPVTEQRRHAEAFLDAIDGFPRRALDLGAGGGLPGLVLAAARPEWTWVFLDAMAKRTSFLAAEVEALGLTDRVDVWTGRAEVLATAARSSFDLVVARSFGPPAVTAESAAPFLAVGGQLVVSEPPGSVGERWPAAGLRQLGLEVDAIVPGPPTLVRLRQVVSCPERFPRRVGAAAKRPLFHVEQPSS